MELSGDISLDAGNALADTRGLGAQIGDLFSVGGGVTDFLRSTGVQGVLTGVNNLRQGNRAQDAINSVNFSPAAQQALLDLFSVIKPAQIQQDFSKGAAIADSASSTQAILQDVLSGLPGIQVRGASAGGYNSTTTKLLSDNLVGQAAAAGSKNQLAYVQSYNQALVNSLQPLLQALNAETAMQKNRASVIEGSAKAGQQKDSGIAGILGSAGSVVSAASKLFGLF